MRRQMMMVPGNSGVSFHMIKVTICLGIASSLKGIKCYQRPNCQLGQIKTARVYEYWQSFPHSKYWPWKPWRGPVQVDEQTKFLSFIFTIIIIPIENIEREREREREIKKNTFINNEPFICLVPGSCTNKSFNKQTLYSIHRFVHWEIIVQMCAIFFPMPDCG